MTGLLGVDATEAAETFAYVCADLVVIVLWARVVGALFLRLRQPRIVGEIVAGVMLGPTLLGGHVDHLASGEGAGLVNKLFPPPAFEALSALGQLALVLYMLMVGLELRRALLTGRATQVAAIGLAAAAGPAVLGLALAPIMDGATWRPAAVPAATFAAVLGAALAVPGVPVIARILQERGRLATSTGALAIASGAVATVLAFGLTAVAVASEQSEGLALRSALSTLVLVALAALAVALLSKLRTPDPPRAVQHASLAIVVAAALLGGLAADRIFGTALVGGLIVGLLLPERAAISHETVRRLRGPAIALLLPIFLTVSGLQTDLRVLGVASLGGLALFLALLISAKWSSVYVAARMTGMAGAEANILGVLLNCPGLVVLAVGLIGLQGGVITDEMQAAIVLGSILTTATTGPLLDWAVRRQRGWPPPARLSESPA